MTDLKDASSDYAEGYRGGFEDARQAILRAVMEAVMDGRSVRAAVMAVPLPPALREPTGLEYRAG